MSDSMHDPGLDGHEAPTTHLGADEPSAMPTDSLVASSVGDRCVNCGTPLTSDQRYCVVCGERRGASRFALPTVAPVPAAATPQSTIVRGRRGPLAAAGFSGGTTLIAGVATLLLAMLVGVLIGHNTANNNAKTTAAAPVKIIKVDAGGGTAAPAASNTGSGATAASGSGKASKAKVKSGAAHKRTSAKTAASTAAAKKQAAEQASAAAKVTGGKNQAPATVTVGSKCAGAECNKAGFNKKTHKFDGSFFGQ